MEFAQASKNPPLSYRDAHLEVDFDQRTVILDSGHLGLTKKEFELLSLLVYHAGDVIPRETLLERVWGYSQEIRTRTLDVHIRKLRQKLGGTYSRHYIETIFGVGYRFQPLRRAQQES
jgi:DNA-binding response OmpR family regulator